MVQLIDITMVCYGLVEERRKTDEAYHYHLGQ